MVEGASQSEARVTALTIAYDGAPFHGFARQPGLDTVQGTIEAALSTALRRPIETIGAGRTDAGVHALGQVVSFESAPGDPEPARLRRSVDALAGPAIAVTAVRSARPGFSARFDAVSREYRYRVSIGAAAPLFIGRFCWHVRHPLDLGEMREAARYLIGEHDFASFCLAESAEGQRTIRRVEDIVLAEEHHLGEECLTITVRGNAFLHSMVRIIVGSLVEVGSGRREPGWMSAALAACDRASAGPTAPPQGLTLWAVEYHADDWLDMPRVAGGDKG